jgi:hypothetical protein
MIGAAPRKPYRKTPKADISGWPLDVNNGSQAPRYVSSFALTLMPLLLGCRAGQGVGEPRGVPLWSRAVVHCGESRVGVPGCQSVSE